VLALVLTSCMIATARHYASMTYAVIMCPSVRLSQADTVQKRLSVGSRK